MRRFTVYAPSAVGVQLQLLAPVTGLLGMHRGADGSWYVDVDGIRPGQRYGFRCTGPEHNPRKLVLDPRSRAIAGYLEWHPATRMGQANDSAPFVPHSVVTPQAKPLTWQRPAHRPDELVVYEAHVKGLTKMHPAVPPRLRGTYAGLAHPAVIAHLTALGVTAIELLPVHAFVSEPHLMASGRTNHWGYSTIGYFAPHNAYTACERPEDGPEEFRTMVRALHAAGIEVWLDVVYNHTGEGGPSGPTLLFRGLGASDWYRTDNGRYIDFTGCGNTLDVNKPHVQDLIVDSLRYWAQDMGVDGFRFDLAVTLGRRDPGFDPDHPLLERIRTDPILRHRRTIAEPWDLGPHGYGVGRFGPTWMEWNGQYRDTVRDLWRGVPLPAEAVTERLTGSPDLTTATDRDVTASVNFITCHDGFTLADLVAYAHKHNHANGEDNRDGSTDNRSFNGGVEGPTDDAAVLANRRLRQRALLLTLLTSHGTPMLLMGDELGRTQRGNNNAYCQDNPLSWVDWSAVDTDLLAFVQQATTLRREQPALHAPSGTARCRNADGTPLSAGHESVRHALVLELDADTDHPVVVALNTTDDAVPLVLPEGAWTVALSSGGGSLEVVEGCTVTVFVRAE